MFIVSTTYSQNPIGTIDNHSSASWLVTKSKPADDTILGTPYVNDAFLPAKIHTNSEKNTSFYIRYNALADEFEVKGAGDKNYALKKDRKDILVEFIGTEKYYRVYDFIENENIKSGYFVILTNKDANTILLKRESVTLIKKKVAVTSYDSDKPAQYKRNSDEFFIKLPSGNAVELPRNKKDIAKLFPEHSKKVLDYIKSNKIKTSKESDLIQLTNYLNTL